MSDDRTEAELDLLLFEMGGRRYGADVSEVVRVGRTDAFAGRERALFVRSEDGESGIPIDRVIGVKRVPARTVKPLPEYAKGLVAPALVGFALEGSEILLLIDLEALVDETQAVPARAALPVPGVAAAGSLEG